MNNKLKILPRWIALVVLTAGASRASAQYSQDYLEYTGDRGLLPQAKYLKIDFEAEQDTSHSGGNTITSDRLYATAGFGIGWNRYIYHPYLLTYSLIVEPNYVWQNDRVSGTPAQSQNDWLLNGSFVANVLGEKPYATTLTYNRSHEEVKYDFFNSATVDTDGWGVATGYHEGPVPIRISYSQSHQDSSGLNQNSITDQSILNFNAKNEREKLNRTDFNYQFGQFDRTTDVGGSSYKNENSYHRVNVMDTENFTKSVLKSMVLFNDIESSTSASENLNATLNYNVRHNPHLHSYYDYAFSQFSGNGSDSFQNYATVGFDHQLFDSLSSGMEIHGNQTKSSSGNSTLDSHSGGADGNVNYNKRLGDWGHLSIGNNASYNLTEQQTTGAEVLVVNESHVVPNTDIVILNRPRDVSIASVTDGTGTITLQPGLDYTVNQSTDPWQITINNFGPNNVQPGDTILVTYTVKSNPSGDYSTFGDQSQVTLGFWDGKADIFARYNFTKNWASAPGFVLEDDQEFQTGANFHWQGLSLHGDFDDHHSTTYDNKSYNLAESYGRGIFGHSTIGVNFNQQWNTFTFNSTSGNTVEHVTFYNSMLNYEWHPTGGLNWTVQAGLQQQRGSGNDQDLFAVRTYLNWTIGKLQTHLGFEHDDQDFSGQVKKRDFVFLRIRRNF